MARWTVVALLLVGTSAGCEGTPRPAMTIPSSAAAYFPPGVFSRPDVVERLGSDEFVVEWYGKHLRAMGEPSLWDAKRPMIRFTMLPSFWKPISVRIEPDGEGAVLTATRLSGSGGYDPGTIEWQETRRLSSTELTALESRFVSFAQTPTLVEDTSLDGAEFIVERQDGVRYHVVTRNVPAAEGRDADYRALCDAILALAPDGLTTKRPRLQRKK